MFSDGESDGHVVEEEKQLSAGVEKGDFVRPGRECRWCEYSPWLLVFTVVLLAAVEI